MRRLFILIATAAMLLAAVSPAAAAVGKFSYTVHGSGAWASGVRYTETTFDAAWIEIGDQATRATDGDSFSSYLLFEHFRERCDESGCITIDTSGWADGVAFTLDRKKLAGASVAVAVPAVRCRDNGRRVTCRDVTVRVQVAWTGYGPMIRSHGTANGGIAGQYQYTLNGAATERWANVSGSIGGFDLSTASPIGAMYRTRQAERTITHG